MYHDTRDEGRFRMMQSLRGRLFLILLLATGALWLSATAWIYLGSRVELEHVLDARLREAARMVNSLVLTNRQAIGSDAPAEMPAFPIERGGYERQLSCQVWSLEGHLMAQSSGAPSGRMSPEGEGFSNQMVDGELWRVFTLEAPERGLRVMVGDRVGLRDRLVRDLILGLVAPALLIVPLLALLIWVSLGRGLRPLTELTCNIAARGPDDMRRVNAADAPAEVRPLAKALNGLFAKVETARRHEREVTAFAAHELRTPLAGLKTQAQIALASPAAPTREAALRQILVSVDRSSRLVRQLLTLSRLDAGEDLPRQDMPVAVGPVLEELVREEDERRAMMQQDMRQETGQEETGQEPEKAPPLPLSVRITIDPALEQMQVQGDGDALRTALRNLLENALQYGAPEGAISCRALTPSTLCVEDEGPGIAPEELELVTRRFYRGHALQEAGSAASTTRNSGTGLGLAIVEAALARLGARMELANRTDRNGLRVTIHFGAET